MKLVLDERLKHRLVGFAVIISIAAIFAPAMIKKSNQRFETKHFASIRLPQKPMLPDVSPPEKQVLFKISSSRSVLQTVELYSYLLNGISNV